MTPAERSQRWRSRHPEQSKQIMRDWRRKNKATMAFLNRRNKLARRLMIEWVRRYRPDVLAACRKKAKQLMPIADLVIAQER